METIIIIGVAVMLACGVFGIGYAVYSLIRSERKKKMPDVAIPPLKTVVTSDVAFFDKEETFENCTVQILTNTKTGETSVGWWKNE